MTTRRQFVKWSSACAIAPSVTLIPEETYAVAPLFIRGLLTIRRRDIAKKLFRYIVRQVFKELLEEMFENMFDDGTMSRPRIPRPRRPHYYPQIGQDNSRVGRATLTGLNSTFGRKQSPEEEKRYIFQDRFVDLSNSKEHQRLYPHFSIRNELVQNTNSPQFVVEEFMWLDKSEEHYKSYTYTQVSSGGYDAYRRFKLNQFFVDAQSKGGCIIDLEGPAFHDFYVPNAQFRRRIHVVSEGDWAVQLDHQFLKT